MSGHQSSKLCPSSGASNTDRTDMVRKGITLTSIQARPSSDKYSDTSPRHHTQQPLARTYLAQMYLSRTSDVALQGTTCARRKADSGREEPGVPSIYHVPSPITFVLAQPSYLTASSYLARSVSHCRLATLEFGVAVVRVIDVPGRSAYGRMPSGCSPIKCKKHLVHNLSTIMRSRLYYKVYHKLQSTSAMLILNMRRL